MTSERANPTVLDLVATALRAQGFDGLFNTDAPCGCTTDDLAPCGEIGGSCEAGYEVPGCSSDCGNGCDFHLARTRATEEQTDGE